MADAVFAADGRATQLGRVQSPLETVAAGQRRVPASAAPANPSHDPHTRGLAAPFRHDTSQSCGVTHTGNLLIHGENLQVLTELRRDYLAAVRCIYIDPPYNNQERYRHYDDNRSHEQWLRMMEERLAALRPLLAPTGSLWISIDDREVHYLKVAADRIFGRQNFISTMVWQQRTTRENRRVFSNNHEYILVYAADPEAFRKARNPAPAGHRVLARYKNPDGDLRGPWQSVSANVQDGHATASQHYELIAPNGTRHRPPEGRCWVYTAERMEEEVAAGRVWFGADGKRAPRLKRYLHGQHPGLTPETLWLAGEVGTNDEAKKQLLRLFPEGPVFDTPKPERLLARILSIATNEGDLVLDAFLGSGTTSVVAHKMNRMHVGVEQGDQAVALSRERLRRVIAGDSGGISAEVGWMGGGGFDFYRLG
jgi:adenine-specific DNA-methyltransferase